MREVNLTEKLSAAVEGDIGEVDGVLRITEIRIRYRIVIAGGNSDKIDRALATYSDKCPAYQSVKDCIPCIWEAEFIEP